MNNENKNKLIRAFEARVRYCEMEISPGCTCIDRFPFVVCESDNERNVLALIDGENSVRFSAYKIPTLFSRDGAEYAVKYFSERGIKSKALNKRKWCERRLAEEKKKLEEYAAR